MGNPVIPRYKVNGVIKKDIERNQKFFSAIESGNLSEVKELYRESHVARAEKISGKKATVSALLLATLCQHTHVVEFLIKKNYWEIYKWNDDNESPLSEAIKSGNQVMVRIMVKEIFKHYYFFQSLKDKNGNTPLHYVGQLKDQKVRRAMAIILIEAGMDIHFENNNAELPQHFDEMVAIEQAYKNRFSCKLKRHFLFNFDKITSSKMFLLGFASAGIGLSLALITASAIAIIGVYGCFVAYITASLVFGGNAEACERQQINADFEYMLEHGIINQEKLTKYYSLISSSDRVSERRTLQLAVSSGNLDEIRLFINDPTVISSSMIESTITKGHFQAFCLLIDKALTTSNQNVINENVIMEIILHNRSKMLDYLLKKGIELPCTVKTYPFTTLDHLSSRPVEKVSVSLREFARKLSGNKQIIQLIERAQAKKNPTKVVTPLFEGKRQNVRQVSARKASPEKVHVRKPFRTASK